MALSALFAAVLAFQEPDHPYQLKIGRNGFAQVQSGLADLRSGKAATLNDIVRAAEGKRFVLVGESHDDLNHHQMQADIIKALSASGRYVAVGMEMFTRDNQRNVTPFSRGIWSDEQFIEKSNWKTQWGFDFNLYKPVFDAVRELKSPLYALNIPRDWVREIGRQGVSAVTSAREPWVPNLKNKLGNQNHKAVFSGLMGGHPMSGPQADNVYAAQVSWDVGMANSAIHAMADKFSDNWVMVIVVGSGHVMYDQGVNYRLKEFGADSMSVVCIEGAPDNQVSRGLGDFVYVSGAKPVAKGE